jgi:peptidoglycan/xylan/chitin deacetylase (PgdA/CDA1 family)
MKLLRPQQLSPANPVLTAYRKVRAAKNRFFNFIDRPNVVLLYHRVTNLSSDPEVLAVTPDNFRTHIRHLKETVPIVRFGEDWSKIRRPVVAITFDDGYADNVLEALPILEEEEVHATFFVSTENIDTMREHWWDELGRIITRGRHFPESFTLRDERLGRTWPTSTPAERDALYCELHYLIMRLDPARREPWLAQLRRWAQVDETGREEYRTMTSDELRRLASSEWASIGAHTVTHTPLSILSEEAQRDEIVSSKRRLEALLGMEIRVFSYPFGTKNDYNRTSVRICREAGFVKAAANFPGQAHRWTDPYQIPRQLVRNWGPDTFAARVADFWVR